MLDDVAALVGRNGRSSDGVPVIDVLAEVHRLCLGIVVVRKGPVNGDDADVPDSMVLEHTARHIGAGNSR